MELGEALVRRRSSPAALRVHAARSAPALASSGAVAARGHGTARGTSSGITARVDRVRARASRARGGRRRPRARRSAAARPNSTGITGSSEPWATAIGVAVELVEVELEALHLGHEAGERDDRGRPRPAGAEAERPAHHGALREAAEHDPVDRHRQPVEERRQPRRSVGKNVAGSGVGMPPSRYQCAPPGGSASGARGVIPSSRRSGSSASSSGIEVVLVGAAAVQEHERALAARPRRAARARRQLDASRRRPGGARVGQRRQDRLDLRAQVLERGGRISVSPRCSASSSIAKPGPSVAISNSTPLGSRK